MMNQGLTKVLTKYLYRYGRTVCAALLALGLMPGHGVAAPKRVPKPHGFPLSKPPGNVAADDYGPAVRRIGLGRLRWRCG